MFSKKGILEEHLVALSRHLIHTGGTIFNIFIRMNHSALQIRVLIDLLLAIEGSGKVKKKQGK